MEDSWFLQGWSVCVCVCRQQVTVALNAQTPVRFQLKSSEQQQLLIQQEFIQQAPHTHQFKQVWHLLLAFELHTHRLNLLSTLGILSPYFLSTLGAL